MNDLELSSNLPAIFLNRVEKYALQDALYFKNTVTGKMDSWSWQVWAKKVREIACGLAAKGVQRGDRIGLLSENRPEWAAADLAILSLGAVNVPIYITSSLRDVRYILEDAGIHFLFLSRREHYDRLKDALNGIYVILFDVEADGKDLGQGVASLQCLMEEGFRYEQEHPEQFPQWVRETPSEALATLIYTSGTTGPPKGVMLSHRNFIANYLGASEWIRVSEKDLALSFLPLSHVFERLAGYYFMTFHGARIAYSENMQSVPEDLIRIKPTVAASVPRLYEKIYARIQENIQKSSPLQRKIFHWASRVGSCCSAMTLRGEALKPWLALQHFLADRLVYRKLKARLGGRLRFFISGGAPLSKELAEFFYSAGVLILEGYGLTETSPVIAVNSEKCPRFGTVGRPLPNIEVRIAEDGEILTRGPCVMQGYYNNPEATQSSFDGGWFRTGDIGELDADGFLKITDRKKDIIVTSGGKNISPQNIEGVLLSDPLFVQTVVVGDKRNYLVALIVPNRIEVQAKAASLGISDLPWEKVIKHPKIVSWVAGRLEDRTRDLARYEQIKYFTLLDRELSIAEGELTPTLKVKRKLVMQKFSELIEAMYLKGEALKERGT